MQGGLRRGGEGRRRGCVWGCSFVSPPPHPLHVKKKTEALTSPFSIPMDRITRHSSPETSAPPLTTERVPAPETCDRSRLPWFPLLLLRLLPLPSSQELWSLVYLCLAQRGDHEDPLYMCPPRFPAVVHPARARLGSISLVRREASSGGASSSSPRCHQPAHFFLSVRSAGCLLWALRLRIPTATGYVVVGEDNEGRMNKTRISDVWRVKRLPQSDISSDFCLSTSPFLNFAFGTMESVEKECGALGGLFQAIVNDMKVTCKLKYTEILFDLCGCTVADHTYIFLLPLSLSPGPPPLETPLQDKLRDETCFPLCYLHNVQQVCQTHYV